MSLHIIQMVTYRNTAQGRATITTAFVFVLFAYFIVIVVTGVPYFGVCMTVVENDFFG
jgi:hypothetical protein